MLIFSLDRPMGEAASKFLDEELRDLRLALSLEKTQFFDDPAEAKANLRDAEIDYMQDATIYDRGIGLYTVKRSFRRFLCTAPNDVQAVTLALGAQVPQEP